VAKGRNDLELVTAARSGDSAAFGRLFDRWFDRVADVAWRIVRNRDTAAEVARTSFVAAWEQRSELRSSEEFGPWLLCLARRQALDRLEHDRRPGAGSDEGGLASRRRGGSSSAASSASSAPSADGTAEGNVDDQIVWAAFAALGERDASLLDLHLRQGVPADLLADDLGVASGEATLAMEQKCSLLAVALRSWGLWSAASDRCPRLTEALAAGGATNFGEAVRAISSHAAGCSVCSEAQQALPEPEAQFAAVLVATAPVAMRAQAASGLQAAGIEVGTAFSRSKPTGEVEKVVAPATSSPPSVRAEAPTRAAPPAPARSETVARPTVAERLAARGAKVGGASPPAADTPRDDFPSAGAYRPVGSVGSGVGDATAASPAPDPEKPSPPASARRNRRLALVAAAVVLVVGVTGVALSSGESGEDDHRVESGASRSDDSGFVSEGDADDEDAPPGATPDGPAAADDDQDGSTTTPGLPGATLPSGETIPPGSGGVGGLIPGDPTGTVPGDDDDPGAPPGTAATTTTQPDGSPAETTTTTAAPPPPPAGPPEITSFRATDAGNCGLLNLNKSMVFTWRSTGADSATFGRQGGTKAAVDPNGSATACAPIGTTFQLVVTGSGGSDSASSTVSL
jgi:DNA-directed RNA polymerase specialized sigma24 family protein